MRKIVGGVVLALGAWALIAPQAMLGLNELRWLGRHTFPGEIFVGMMLLALGYYLCGRAESAV